MRESRARAKGLDFELFYEQVGNKGADGCNSILLYCGRYCNDDRCLYYSIGDLY